MKKRKHILSALIYARTLISSSRHSTIRFLWLPWNEKPTAFNLIRPGQKSNRRTHTWTLQLCVNWLPLLFRPAIMELWQRESLVPCSMSRAVRFLAVSTLDKCVVLNPQRFRLLFLSYFLSPIVSKTNYCWPRSRQFDWAYWGFEQSQQILIWPHPKDQLFNHPGCTVLVNWLWNGLLAVKYAYVCMHAAENFFSIQIYISPQLFSIDIKTIYYLLK